MRATISRCLAAFVFAGNLMSCADAAEPLPVAEVVVTPGQTTLQSLGETLQLSAIARDANGNEISGKTVTWSSSSATVATVSQGAVATAVANGNATVTATVDGVSGSATIQVAQAVVQVTVTPGTPQLASIGDTVQMVATSKDALGSAVADKTPSWITSATSVAHINGSGLVTAMANGSAVVTAIVDGIGGTASVTVAQVPAKLAFVGRPLPTQSGVVIPAISIRVQDAMGTTVASATHQVTIDLENHPSQFQGVSQVAATNGVATFNGLAINDPRTDYRFTATASGLTPAISGTFEIMSVPARIDSVKLSTTSLKIGTSLSYSIWVTNGAGRSLTGAGIQGHIVQNGFRGSSGTAASGCSTTSGVVPHGRCVMQWSLGVNGNSGAVAGAATARIIFHENGTNHGTVDLPITLVP